MPPLPAFLRFFSFLIDTITSDRVVTLYYCWFSIFLWGLIALITIEKSWEEFETSYWNPRFVRLSGVFTLIFLTQFLEEENGITWGRVGNLHFANSGGEIRLWKSGGGYFSILDEFGPFQASTRKNPSNGDRKPMQNCVVDPFWAFLNDRKRPF